MSDPDTQHPTPDPRSYTPKHLADKILTARAALEGERKQVTVLFADVKGSMELAEQVDPEEWPGYPSLRYSGRLGGQPCLPRQRAPCAGLSRPGRAGEPRECRAGPGNRTPVRSDSALFFDGQLHKLLGDVEVARERAEAVIALATEHGFYQFVVFGMLLRGCAVADGGQIDAGITELRGALDVMRAAGAEMARPFYTGMLAEAYGKAGQPAQGLALLEEAVDCMNRTGQRLFEAPLQRIKGDLLLAVSRDRHAEAEDCFRHAIDCARRQNAKSWELAAALSLSRLWREQGKHDDARTLLAEIYGWFTEGFETRDLRAAKVLLDELSPGR